MRLIFMGNPQFAVPTLHKLLSSRHEVAAVVTSPDRPQGRGQKPCSPAVTEAARARRVPVIQQEDLSEPHFLSQITALAASLFVIVAFRILPAKLFSIPSQGAINLHASLLPKYRGAAPIQWALINGERETGLTTFLIQQKVDTGGILLQEKVEIFPDETADELSDRLADLGAELVLKTVDLIESGDFQVLPQDQLQATRAPKIEPEDGLIDWSMPGERIVNLIRGLSSRPGAFTLFAGQKLKIYRAALISAGEKKGLPGEVLKADQKCGLIVQTGKGAVQLLEVQLEGRKRMPCCDYLRGCPIAEGMKLG